MARDCHSSGAILPKTKFKGPAPAPPLPLPPEPPSWLPQIIHTLEPCQQQFLSLARPRRSLHSPWKDAVRAAPATTGRLHPVAAGGGDDAAARMARPMPASCQQREEERALAPPLRYPHRGGGHGGIRQHAAFPQQRCPRGWCGMPPPEPPSAPVPRGPAGAATGARHTYPEDPPPAPCLCHHVAFVAHAGNTLFPTNACCARSWHRWASV